MQLRCKPGDLAVIIHDTVEGASDVGKLVRIVRVADWFCDAEVHEWTCCSEGAPLFGYDADGDLGRSFYRDIQDRYLRPIRPQSDPETVTRDTEVTA